MLFFVEHEITDKILHAMADQEVLNMHIQIKMGREVASKMILMFTLGREKVFAVEDFGIQQAMAILYGIQSVDKRQIKAQKLKQVEKWQSYPTYACMYLWSIKYNCKKITKT
ncbi:MAG: hypothetical protein MUC81_03785 [Bacteroidia bacterium]|jgi:DNA-3-methyladenine glycosylase II|nr:hypothetical protein [Bacteroidia bacterium]